MDSPCAELLYMPILLSKAILYGAAVTRFDSESKARRCHFISSRSKFRRMPGHCNVVLILADHHRWDYTGAHRPGVISTPNLDRLAASGAVLGGMYSTSPLCVPQRIA